MQASVDLPDLATSTAAVVAGEPVEVDLVLESIPQGVVRVGHRPGPVGGGVPPLSRGGAGTAEIAVKEIFERTPTEGETWPLGPDEIDLEPVRAGGGAAGPAARTAVRRGLPGPGARPLPRGRRGRRWRARSEPDGEPEAGA